MSRVSDFVDAVEAQLADATVLFEIGLKNEGKHGQRRRVHWYRVGGEIEQNDRKGGKLTDGETTRTVSVWRRLELVRMCVFAESETTIDTLLDNLIVAVDRAAGVNAVRWEQYIWHENEHAQRIPMVELEFRLALPVADEISTLVFISAVENTVEFVESLDE